MIFELLLEMAGVGCDVVVYGEFGRGNFCIQAMIFLVVVVVWWRQCGGWRWQQEAVVISVGTIVIFINVAIVWWSTVMGWSKVVAV